MGTWVNVGSIFVVVELGWLCLRVDQFCLQDEMNKNILLKSKKEHIPASMGRIPLQIAFSWITTQQ